MYLNQLMIYLLWPAFILVAWFIIRAAVVLYERKFPPVKEQASEPANE
mgnify:FL=1